MRVVLGVVGLAEGFASGVESRVHGTGGDSQAGGDGRSALALELVEHEHHPLIFVEGIECSLYPRQGAASIRAFAKRVGPGVPLLGVGVQQYRTPSAGLHATPVVAHHAECDAGEPGARLGRPGSVAAFAMHDEEDVLDEIVAGRGADPEALDEGADEGGVGTKEAGRVQVSVARVAIDGLRVNRTQSSQRLASHSCLL